MVMLQSNPSVDLVVIQDDDISAFIDNLVSERDYVDLFTGV